MKNKIGLILIILLNLDFSSIVTTVYALSAAPAAGMELVNTTFTGNTNGVFSPGGTFGLVATITAINQPALGPSVTLASTDSCVTINQASSSYGDISVSQNADNSSSPFQFSISSSCPTGHLINLILTLSATGYSSNPIIIPVLVSIPSVPYITPPYTCVTNYYVSTNGSDTNNGTSVGQAWFSIGHAITYLKALGGTQGGVCVNVQPGTYNEYNYASGLSGTSDTPGGYLVFRSMMPYGAEIQVPLADATNSAGASFDFDEAHFIVIDGFNLQGQVSPGSVENGVSANGYGTPGDHIKIINNLIGNHGGAGVGANHTDYLVVEGNIVFGNANTSTYEVSGISTWQAVASDTAAGFHNIISSNIVFNNAEISDGHATHSDGNGIIIDDSRNTQNGSTYGAYAQQTLVENNLSFGNGGAGIHLYLSDNVTVLNNTVYNNFWDTLNTGTWRGDINVVNGMNNTFVNNVSYANPSTDKYNTAYLDASTNSSNTNNVWVNNLSFNGVAGYSSTKVSGSPSTIASVQGNLLGKDPQFMDPSINEFTLQSTSPAILAGTSTYGFPLQDLAGITRSASAIDMGAYQYSVVPTYTLTVSNTGNGFGMVFGATTSSSSLINCGVNPGATVCSATVNSATAVTLMAAAANGSTFSSWTVTGSPAGTCTGTNSPCVINVNSATSVTANFSTQTYVLTASADSNGAISPSGTLSVTAGVNQTFTVTANTGYTANLTVDGTPATLTGNSYTLSDVTAAHTLVETSTPNTYNITASADSNATITPTSATVAYGGSQTFTITPNAGYTAALTVDGTAVTLTGNTFTLSNVTAAHTLVETSTLNSYIINASSDSNATISPTSATVAYGGSQTFTVTPNAGYTAALTVDGAPVTLTGNSFTLSNVTAAHTLVEISTKNTYNITASADSNATISPTSATVAYGGSQTFTITPNAGYTAALTVDGTAVTLTGNTFTLSNVTAAHTLVETSTLNSYIINASSDSNATISPTSATVAYGGSQTFTVTPNAGYTAALTVDGTAVTLTGNSFTLSNVTAAHTLVEISTKNTYNITASADSNATITPTSATVAYGGSQTFTITPNTGYTAQLTVDGTAVTLTANSYTLSNVTAAHTLAVISSVSSQTVTINAGFGAGGLILPFGNINVNYGGSQTFILLHSAGYDITSLTVDGAPVTLTGNTFTLSNVTSPHTLKANFSVQTVTITASAGTGGTISLPASKNINYGSHQMITVTPNAGYTAQLTVDGNPVTLNSDNSYMLGYITKPHTIAASFSSSQTT